MLKTKLFSKDFSTRQKVDKEDFSRNRVWGFAETFACVLLGLKRSLTVHVYEFLSNTGSGNDSSKQAFSKARQKLKPEGFIELNGDLVDQYYADDDFKQFKTRRVLAIDGSDVRLPNTPEIIEKFGLCSGIPMASASVLYDPLNRITLDAILDPYLKGNERKQAQAHVKNLPKKEGARDILLLDRGYPDMVLIYSILTAGMDFVIRFTPDSFIKPLYSFASTDAPLDSLVEVDSSKLSYSVVLKTKTYRKNQPSILNMRVIRLQRDASEDIILLTNLTDTTEFPYECFEELYHLRWGIETCYDYLKNTLEVENFAAKSPEGVFQEFYATILCANINQLVVEAAEEIAFPEKATVDRQINRSIAAGLSRGQLIQVFFSKKPMEETLEKLAKKVAKSKIATKPGRSFPRKVKPHSNHHITKRRIY